jgi:uncharacterized membrane protein
MDIKRTSGKRVSASRRDSFTAQSNQAIIRKPWKSLAAVAFGLLLSVPGLAQTQYRFSPIDVPGATRTSANGNSPYAIAGDFDDAFGKTHGFVVNKNNGVLTTFTTIDVPRAKSTSLNGINAPGQLVGTYTDTDAAGTDHDHAFFKNNGSPPIPLDPPGTVRSQGGFINSQGQAVGEYRTDKARGFIWRNGTFTTLNLNFPNDLRTVPFGINDRGAVVGTYLTADNINHGFLRSSNGDFKTIDVPGADVTVAEGINDAGTIVGVCIVKGLFHGFVSQNGLFTTVDVPGSSETQVFSINAIGEIVGEYVDSTDVQHGFLGVPAR